MFFITTQTSVLDTVTCWLEHATVLLFGSMKAVRFEDLWFEDDLLNFMLVFGDSYWANKALLVQSTMGG